MCCRYFLEMSPELRPYIEAAGHAPLTESMVSKLARPLVSSGEIRPTDIAVTLAPAKDGRPRVFPMVWGFTNPKSNAPVFNCRAETAADKPMWKESWARRRCIIPASYYFEWEHLINPATGRKKTGDKYMIQPKDCSAAYLAGLYRIEELRGIKVPVFSVLTREPGEAIRFIHDRMPVMLPRESIQNWLRPENKPEEIIKGALTEMVFEKAR